jgi:hypothetical protein
MYNDVTAEYDLAIRETPNSATLLRAAANINTRTGDLQRAQEYTVKARQAEAE